MKCRPLITIGRGIHQLITTGRGYYIGVWNPVGLLHWGVVSTGYGILQLIPFTVCTPMHFHAGDSFIDSCTYSTEIAVTRVVNNYCQCNQIL